MAKYKIYNGSAWIEYQFDPALHNHNASDVNAGTLSADRIPSLDAAKIATGTIGEPRIPTLPITKISKGTWSYGINGFLKPMFDVLRADRTSFLPADQIIIEQSTDAGITWQSANISETNKKGLFTGARPGIPLPMIDGVKNTNCMLRVTITGMKYNQTDAGGVETARYNYWNSTYVQSTERYCTFDEGWAWVLAVSDRIWMRVERATGANPNSWSTVREAWLSGWSGGNYFTLDGSVFGGSTGQINNSWNWRFTFRTGTTAEDFDNTKLVTGQYASQTQQIFHLKLTGANVWAMPNRMMYHDHLYGWDNDQNAWFPGTIRANGSNGQLVILDNDARLSNARPASDVFAWAKAANKPSYNASEIGGLGASYRWLTDTYINSWNAKANIATDNGGTITSWTADSTHSGYGYRGSKPISGVTTSDTAYVIFSPASADSGFFASVCDTYNGGVYIYSKVNNQNAGIERIIIFKG